MEESEHLRHDLRADGYLEPRTAAFYRRAMAALTRAGVPFLVGGAYAFQRYTGIERHTRDFDVFVEPRDCRRALRVLAAAGHQTELTYPHWLGKAFHGEDYVDVIFASGNGVARVDGEWFRHAVADRVLGVPARLCPAEEIIWSKSFVMERERYDGADVMHLLRATAERLDWERLLRRFGPHSELLLSYLVLFAFVYPAERGRIPAHVLDRLLEAMRFHGNGVASEAPLCRGTLVSRLQYLADVTEWGMRDARLKPEGPMSEEDVAHWTAAGLEEQ